MIHVALFIRHGETTWNVEHRLPGHLPGIELTADGREDAARLAQALAVLPISAIISSPLERAVETASYLTTTRGLSIQDEPALMDIDLGQWTGRNRDELYKGDPVYREFVRDPTLGPAGVETFPQLERRAVAAVERWLERASTGPYPAFVTHADVIKLLLAHYMGLDAHRARTIVIDNASVSVVKLESDLQPRVLTLSWRPQPGWLHASPRVLERLQDEEQVAGEQHS
jgi:broad specificity phosphatase PhoE